MNLRKIFGLTRSALEPPPDTRLADVERRLEDLERRWRKIDVEWSEWFDKYRRLYARLAKREQRDRDNGEHALQDGSHGMISTRVGGNPTPNPLAQRMLNGILPRSR